MAEEIFGIDKRGKKLTGESPEVQAQISQNQQNVDTGIGSAVMDSQAPVQVAAQEKDPIGQSQLGVQQATKEQPINRPVLFGQEGAKSELQRLKESRFSGVEAPSEKNIQEQERDKAQSMIDATEALFQERVADIQQRGKENLAGESSRQTSAGLAGSNFKSTAEGKVQAVTDSALKAESARRNTEILNLMGAAESNAQQRFTQERGEFRNEQDAQIAFLSERQNESRALLGNFFSQGGDISTLDDIQRQKMIEQSGFDGFGLEIFANASKPKADQKDITYQQVGNKVIGFYTEFDQAGNPSIKSFESELPFETGSQGAKYKTEVTKDGTILMIPEEFDPSKPIQDQIVQYGEEGQFGEPASSKQPSSVQEYEFYSQQEQAAGRDPKSFDEYSNETTKPNVIGSSQTGYFEYNESSGEWNKIIEPVKDSSGLDQKVVAQVDTIRKTYEGSPIVKNYNEVLNKKISVDQMVGGPDSGAVDLALVFEFMKALDPTSVVRETEFDSAANTASFFKGAFAKFNGAMTDGTILPEEVRQEFKRLTDVKFDASTSQYDNYRNEQGRLINRKTGDEDGVDYLPDFSGALSNFQESNQVQLPELNRGYNTIDDLVSDVPEYSTEIIRLSEEYPNASDNDLLKIIESASSAGFNNDLSKSKKDLVEKKDQLSNLSNGKTRLSIGEGTVTGIDGSKFWENGLDFVLSGGKGAPVSLPFSGKVIEVSGGFSNQSNKPLSTEDGKSQNGGWGNQVRVELEDGSQVWISHLDSVENIKKGQTIAAGTKIGTQGNTGNTHGNTGVHLDITMKNPNGGYYSPREVALLFGDNRIS